MIERLYSAVKRRRRGLAITSESGTGARGSGAGAPAALAASPLRSEAANAAEEVLVLLVLIKVRFLSPPYSNCSGSTCLTHVGTEGGGTPRELKNRAMALVLRLLEWITCKYQPGGAVKFRTAPILALTGTYPSGKPQYRLVWNSATSTTGC
jgi:hypothetical protein